MPIDVESIVATTRATIAVGRECRLGKQGGSMSRSLGWYARRLSRMSPSEVGWRVGDRVRQVRWAGRQVRPGEAVPLVPGLLTPPGVREHGSD